MLAAVMLTCVSIYAGPDMDEDDVFFRPAGVGKEKKTPMLVFLHQAGACPAYLYKTFNRISDQWGVCVYLPCGGTKLKMDASGYQTYDWRSKDTTNLVAKVREQVKVNNVDPTMVFLSGFSAGASMTYLTGIEAPDLWAGVIPFSGPYPGKYMDQKKLNAAKGKYPTFVIHGNLDETVPVAQIKESVVLLNKTGFKTELYLCDCGHEFPDDWADILSEAMSWCNEN